jgi:6-phospho-beta-glucosidase
MRFVILGGSASATPELADALADWPGGDGRRPPLELVLHGRSRERLEVVAAEMRRRAAGLTGASVEVHTATDLAAALEGADVVLNAVRVGGLDARVFDESFPQRHGCPGEETMGPGGLANALRTVPVVRRYWETVREHAPDALAVNLTNPSGIVVAALQATYGAPVFSVCDSPVVFCDAIADRLGLPTTEVRRRYQGMNHMGWWTPVDDDALEATLDLVSGQDAEAVRAQGAVGAPYVRYYLSPDRILATQQAASQTRAQQLQQLEADLLQGYADAKADLPRRGAVWYRTAVLPLVDAWANGSDDVLILGMRNDGRIPGLPDAVITEGPVRFPEPHRAEALPVPALPPYPAQLLAQQAAYEAMATAATEPQASRTDRLRAMLANPMVSSYDQAVALLDEVETGSPA